MNIRVIKTFCDLVDSGSFSEAAKINNVSQSAVSQQVAALEGEMSTQLLCRGGTNVLPTEAGEAFYRGGLEIVKRYNRMLSAMRVADDEERGVLRVGTIYSVGFYMLEPCLQQFMEAHPDVLLHVEYTHWNHISAAVLRGEMDLGVIAYAQKHRSLEILPLVSETLVFVCSPEHELAGRETIKPAELDHCRLVAFEAGIPTRKDIDKLLRRHKVTPEIVMEFDNVETLKRAVEVNSGAAILPENCVSDEVEDGEMHMARIENRQPWVRQLAIIRRRGQDPSWAEEQFLNLLSQTAR
jgi:LysR family transcriptional regulator, transcriptional activator of the cysJI operon